MTDAPAKWVVEAYAKDLAGFGDAIDRLRPHVAAAAGWLGKHGHRLLPLVGLSPDGKTVVSGGGDGTARLWPVWLAEVGWVGYTCDRIRGYLLLPESGWDQPVGRLARRTCERHARW